MGRIGRQLRWNVLSNTGPVRHQYFFLVLSDARTINRIKQKLYVELKSTDEHATFSAGSVRGEGIRYELFTMTSYQPDQAKINWKKIYGGKIVRDRDIESRDIIDGLANWVSEKIDRKDF